MLKNKIMFLLLIIILMVSLFTIGCSMSGGVKINNEDVLEDSGFIVPLDKEINLKNKKVIFEKAVFDRNSITFVYNSKEIELSASAISIIGTEENSNNNILDQINQETLNLGITVKGNDYHVVTVPHNLKLINQDILIEIDFDGVYDKFNINFPGEKISSITADIIFDSEGNITEQESNGEYRIIVGIGSIIMQSKGKEEFILIDKIEKRVLKEARQFSTLVEQVNIYDSLTILRNQIEITVDPKHKVILIEYNKL